MMKTKKFKVTCPWIKKEQAAHRRALSTWYPLYSATGAPMAASSFIDKKMQKKHNDLVLYGAALAQKRGELPADASGWYGVASWSGGEGSVRFRTLGDTGSASGVVVPLRFLDWSPAPAVEMVDEDFQLAA